MLSVSAHLKCIILSPIPGKGNRPQLRYLPTVALLLLFAGQHPAGNKSEPLPYRLVIEIGRGKLAVSSAVREDLGRELTTAIEEAGCFRSVHRKAPDPPQADDLLLRLTVVNYEEETEYRFSIAQSNAPDLDRDRLTTIELRANLAVELLTLTERLPLRARRFGQHSSWTPRRGEDPREVARELIVAGVVRATRSFVCKGSSSKWAKRLESARANAAKR